MCSVLIPPKFQRSGRERGARSEGHAGDAAAARRGRAAAGARRAAPARAAAAVPRVRRRRARAAAHQPEGRRDTDELRRAGKATLVGDSDGHS